MKLVVALPAFNEEQALPPLLEAISETFKTMDHECSVLVVDDGSSDNTVAVVEKCAQTMPVRLVKHEVNKGLGAAILTCFKEATADLSVDDIVVTMDADNTHLPSLIPCMIEKIKNGADLVIASRYCPGGDEVGLTPFRKVMSRGASTFLKLCFSIPGARDCSCGYRAYNVGLLKKGFGIFGDKLVEQTGFVCMAEVLVKLAMIGARIDEAPLVLRYDLKGGASKMKISRTIKQYFGLARRKKEFLRTARGGTGSG